MEYAFMTADTPLPPCMPFPKALAGLPISSTAKVMYCKMLDAMLTKKLEDENGIPFVYAGKAARICGAKPHIHSHTQKYNQVFQKVVNRCIIFPKTNRKLKVC